MSRPLVLLVGVGKTAEPIGRALLADGKFRVAVLVRAQSVNKTTPQKLKASGAEIRVGDASDSPEKIEAFLQGVDVVISTIHQMFVDQRPLLLAAKKVGVGRVIPSDFGTTAPKGVMEMHDLKLSIREFIEEIDLPHTFIEVGWWTHLLFPYPHTVKETVLTPKYFVGDLQTKLVHTSFESIGLLLARIVADPRTLNRTVLLSDGEATASEMRVVAEKVSGEDFSDYPQVSDEEIQKRVKSDDLATRIMAQYENSVFLRGDNTIANAASRGTLIARELYDDVPIPDIEEEAKKYYAHPIIPEYEFNS